MGKPDGPDQPGRLDRLLACWVSPKLRQVIRFCLMGGFNYLVDLGVFNLLSIFFLFKWPLTAKTMAVAVATLVSWLGNRYWVFHAQRTADRKRELFGFILVNVLGMLPALVCLWVSHHLLGYTSLLADNISGNVIGLIIGTILRYFCYDKLVFVGNRVKK